MSFMTHNIGVLREDGDQADVKTKPSKGLIDKTNLCTNNGDLTFKKRSHFSVRQLQMFT